MAGKQLKFDLTLMNGTFERKFKRCTIDLMKGWRDFGNNMKKSNSILDMSNAFYKLGKDGYLALMKLTGPYGQILQNTIALTVALRKVCGEFEKVEKAALRASNAFKTGGRMGTGNFSKYQNKAKELSQSGTITQEEAMTGMASIAQNNHSLDEKTVDRLLNTSKDAVAFLGGDYASTLGKLGDILDDTTTSYETLRGVGLEFTRAEVEQIKTLKESYRQTEANAIILAKMEEVYKGAEKAQKGTIAGQFQTFGNQWKNMQTSIGKALAPILQFIMAIANPIMELGSAIIGIFEPIGDLLKRSFAPIEGLFTGLLQPLIEGIRIIGSALSELFGDITNIGASTDEVFSIWKAVGNAIGECLRNTGRWIAMLIKVINVALMPIITTFKFIYGLIRKFIDGFKKGLGGTEKLDVFGKIYSFISKIIEIVKKLWELFANNPVIKFLGTVLSIIGQIAGSIIGTLFDAVGEILDKATKGLEKIMDLAKEAYFRFWEALGFDMSEERAAYEREKNQSNNNNNSGSGDNWQDPRMNFRAAFETAGSMSQRIQTNIMQKNSPQAKMVEYLSSINEKLSSVTDSQKQQNEAQTQQLAIMGAQYKATKEINLGFT